MFTSNLNRTLQEQREFELKEKDLSKKEEVNEAFIVERGIQLGVQLQETQKINAGASDGVPDGSIQEKAESVSQGATGGKGKRLRQTSGRFSEGSVNGPKGPDEANGMELSRIGESPDCAPIEGALDGWLSDCGSCRHSWRTGGAVEPTIEESKELPQGIEKLEQAKGVQCEDSEVVKSTLETYRNASGQLVNAHKSSIFFSPNTTEDCKGMCRSILGFSRSSEEGKYLGLPFITGPSKHAALGKWFGEQEILSHGIAEFHAFASINAKERAPSQPVVEEVSRWNPPDYGTLKINSDVEFDVSKKRGGIGLVARDYLGQVIWVGLVARDYLGQVIWVAAIPILNACSAEVVEALGFRWAVTMAKGKGGEHFLFEGDAQWWLM
ncbi:hypothetical protein Vadar_021117 [Vaccinium darrowii]|uniref:Uncharacterized protein n=1 Tax=Vaccinium darrowii TaxID=229202 RepID=A0ACB7YEW0_9ERIC|nr:hypothetical protein Vadar_021117 [Vaccinium darrowii]